MVDDVVDKRFKDFLSEIIADVSPWGCFNPSHHLQDFFKVDAELLLINRRSTPAMSSGTILVAIRAMRVTSSMRYSYLFSKVIELLSSQ